jgi:hypothetical protein
VKQLTAMLAENPQDRLSALGFILQSAIKTFINKTNY